MGESFKGDGFVVEERERRETRDQQRTGYLLIQAAQTKVSHYTTDYAITNHVIYRTPLLQELVLSLKGMKCVKQRLFRMSVAALGIMK